MVLQRAKSLSGLLMPSMGAPFKFAGRSVWEKLILLQMAVSLGEVSMEDRVMNRCSRLERNPKDGVGTTLMQKH